MELSGGMLMDNNGTEWWYVNGQLHREGGLPAKVLPDGSKEWWVSGRLHREGGLPAKVLPDGIYQWKRLVEEKGYCLFQEITKNLEPVCNLSCNQLQDFAIRNVSVLLILMIQLDDITNMEIFFSAYRLQDEK